MLFLNLHTTKICYFCVRDCADRQTVVGYLGMYEYVSVPSEVGSRDVIVIHEEEKGEKSKTQLRQVHSK